MRLTSITLWLCLAVTAVAAAAAETDSSAINKEHPGDTALSQDANGKFQYKSFPGLSALYIFDGDEPGKSNCGADCISAWSPLMVSGGETTEKIGDWTVIDREHGKRQWVYKGQPVYTRYHNMPPDPSSEKQGFHLLKP
ncbi:MAG TPA: hypothetical protein VGN07_20555 [Steroidobacteraceae bacterium]|jgi:predicted lipoprotein with Yx(FWY)xxD motif